MIPRVRAGEPLSAGRQNKVIDALNRSDSPFTPGETPGKQSGQTVFALNTSGVDLPFGACVAIAAAADANPYADAPRRQILGTVVNVDLPAEAGQQWVITAQRIPAGLSGLVYIDGVVLARVRDEDSEDEQVTIDPADDWWHLKRSASGSGVVLWVDDSAQAADESDASAWRWALVRFPVGGGGGGGSTIKLVQAQADGVNGSVSVKEVILKADPSSSPNFETSGSAYAVTYLKL
jgi:hypothetical protein